MNAVHGLTSLRHHDRWGFSGDTSVDRGSGLQSARAAHLSAGRTSAQVRPRVDSWEPSGAAGTRAVPSGVHRFTVDLGRAALTSSSLDALATSIVATVGDVLGLTSDDLADRLASGESLNAVAAATNTPHNDLAAVVRATLPDGLSGSQARALTEQLTSTTWPPTSATVQLPEAVGQTLDVALSATGALLGTTATHLASRLGQGDSLAELAGTAGVNHDDLIAAVTTDLADTTLPDGIDTATLAEQLVTDRATGSADHGSSGTTPTGVRRFQVDLGTAAFAAIDLDELATSIVSTVGDILGLTSDDLAGRLAGGETLTTVAAATGTSHAGLVTMVRATLPDALSDLQGEALAEQLTSAAWPPSADDLRLPEDAAQTVDVTLTATAALLGTTATHLTGQLGHGTSLQNLATTAGVGHDDLVAAVTTDLARATTPDGVDTATLAEQITVSTRSIAPPAAPPSAGSTTQARRFSVDLGVAALAAVSLEDLSTSMVDTVSGFLGITAEDLTAQLATSDSLSTVAQSLGASRDDLLAIVRAVLPDSLQDAQSAALAEQLADSTWPPGSDALETPAASGQTLDVTLTATAALLGTTITDLTAQLGQGASLDELATAGGVSHDDLIAAVTGDLADSAVPDGIDATTLAEQITQDAASTTPPTTPPADPGSAPAAGGGHHRRHHHLWM